MSKVKAYIEYITIWILRGIINIFNVCPIKENRIMFYSFNGKQYSCNPKYIADEISNDKGVEIIWAFRDVEKFTTDLPKGIRTVKYRSLKYYLLAKTSKIIVFNVQGYGELSRRKEQIFIQTWHAGNGYKKVGNFIGIERKVNLMGHKDYSYVMIGSNSMLQRRVRESMSFKGDIIQGTPRMDIFVNQNQSDIRRRVQEKLKYSKEKRLLLYAPTWRSSRKSDEDYLDYERLYVTLKKKFGGDWIIAVRLHPNVKQGSLVNLPYVVNATMYLDMQELLYTADVLISDYSSCIWDYSFTYRPCFLFCYDLESYDLEKSFDIPIQKWRFPICETMDELLEKIEEFNSEQFVDAMEKHHFEMGSFEDGHATERVCNLIRKYLYVKKD